MPTVKIFLIIKTKASEKLKLFANASLIIYCSDQELVNNSD